jgi:hypothetical protein
MFQQITTNHAKIHEDGEQSDGTSLLQEQCERVLGKKLRGKKWNREKVAVLILFFAHPFLPNLFGMITESRSQLSDATGRIALPVH